MSDKDLTALYANASLLCFPSDSEGFGIPVVEAMAFGVPVVATDIPSVREIGGDTVALVPQGDVPALAASIHELLTDEPERARRVALGVERAASYTWERCAAVVADVYRSLAR